MKKYFFAVLTLALFACDKVENPYEPQVASDVDTTLYPNAWSTYPAPVFTPNTNTLRNILLEDYTGHTCVYCPAAAEIAKTLEEDHPGRVLVASIHASPGGLGDFQKTESPTFTHDFTNPQGLEFGLTFQNGYGFSGNPRGTISRITFSGLMFFSPTTWTQKVTDVLTANDLKVNMQAKINYFEATRGMFLHTEIDPKAMDVSKLKLVAYFMEDSLVAPQKFPTLTDLNYVHHDIHRGNVDGQTFGRTLDAKYKRTDGLYQVDMSYRIPEQYNPQNCHVLVYVMDKDTYEVYQVIEVEIP